MTEANITPDAPDSRAALNAAASNVKEATSNIGAKVKETVSDVVDAAKQEGARQKENMNQRVDKGANAAAETLSKLADKLAEAKPDLANTFVGPFVGQTEASIRSVASYLNDSKPDAYLSDFAAFAKRNPTMVIGGAVAIGFLLARATKVAAEDLRT